MTLEGDEVCKKVVREAKLDVMSVTDSTRNGSRVPDLNGGGGWRVGIRRKSCVMHVNSVEGRGWLGNKVDRCDGLSEMFDGGHQPSGAVCICSGTRGQGLFPAVGCPVRCQSNPVQPR